MSRRAMIFVIAVVAITTFSAAGAPPGQPKGWPLQGLGLLPRTREELCAGKFAACIECGGRNIMPLVRIDLTQGTSLEYRKCIGDGVHQAMVEALAVPAEDRFQVITEHPPGELIFSRTYLGIPHTDKIVFIQITLSTGRKPQQKRKLYKRITELLASSPGVDPKDVIINLAEVVWENWSFGSGEAHYMDA
jgi:4-oxalocrotonate tautomerase